MDRISFKLENIQCLELSVCETCNYKCRYCVFWRNKNMSKSFMSKDFALQVTDEFLNFVGINSDSAIYFGTGEPLLNWEVVKEVVTYVRNKSETIKLNLMTNGSLITNEHVLFFKKYNMGVGLSIDGKRNLQNLNRPSNDSNLDSYDVVISALETAKSLGYSYYSLSSTFNSIGFSDDAYHIIQLCISNNIKEFALDFDTYALDEKNIVSVVNELVSVYNKAINENLSVFGYWLIPYYNEIIKHNKNVSFCGNAIGKSVCISSDGRLKACGYDQKSFDYSFFKLISETDLYLNYLYQHSLLSDRCLTCSIMHLCKGQCLFSSKNDKFWNINCDFYIESYNQLKKKYSNK